MLAPAGPLGADGHYVFLFSLSLILHFITYVFESKSSILFCAFYSTHLFCISFNHLSCLPAHYFLLIPLSPPKVWKLYSILILLVACLKIVSRTYESLIHNFTLFLNNKGILERFNILSPAHVIASCVSCLPLLTLQYVTAVRKVRLHLN